MIITCFRYLVTGCSMRSLVFAFLIGHSTIHNIIKETCQEIWNILSPIYIRKPTNEKWKWIAKEFFEKWNLPNCLGAIDGKHVIIFAPPNSGSLYYNYKGSFIQILLAIVDANYNFIIVDIGAFGSQSDGGIFKSSPMGKKFDQDEMNVPKDERLPNYNYLFPYFLVGDAAFPLKKYIMRPYPGEGLSQRQRIFNYCLSRARRVVENAFGILCSRWRIFLTKINAHPDTEDCLIAAAVALHNFASKTQVSEDIEKNTCLPTILIVTTKREI